MTAPRCAVLVLNWNGMAHLRLLLPSLRIAAAHYPAATRIVVVDNRSTEPDVALVAREFPEVEVVVAAHNDFLFSLNPIVAACPEEIVIILNNDMRVDSDFVAPLVRHFDDPTVFAVTANVFDWDGVRRTTGQRRMALRRWWFYKWWDLTVTEPTYTLDAGGGCAAFRRFCMLAILRKTGPVRAAPDKPEGRPAVWQRQRNRISPPQTSLASEYLRGRPS